MAREGCNRCGQRVGWISIGSNVSLTVLKLIVGLTSGSKAVLADALHSASNILTSFAIFLVRKLTGKPTDDSHPYGHGKVEFLAAAGVSALVLVMTVVLVVEALLHLIYAPPAPPHFTAIVCTAISIVANEMLYRYFRCVGTQLNSQTIKAAAWANRADSFSSMAVLAGVVGAQFGFLHLDPIAALVVAAIIIKIYVGTIKESIAGLMDRSVPPQTMAAVRRVLSNEQQVEEVRYLRARQLGNKIWVELGVRVAAGHTVAECESIAARLQQRILSSVQDVAKVLVDFDPVAG